MLDIMYEVPFLDGIKRCRITEDVITHHGQPEIVVETTNADAVKTA